MSARTSWRAVGIIDQPRSRCKASFQGERADPAQQIKARRARNTFQASIERVVKSVSAEEPGTAQVLRKAEAIATYRI